MNFIPNPWAILGAVLTAILLFVSGHHIGYKDGVLAQTVADQIKITEVSAKIEANKREANAQLIAATKNVSDILIERADLHTKLEQEHQQNVETTDRLHTALDAVRLSYVRSGDSGPGPSGSDSVSTSGQSTGNAEADRIELPADASRFLFTQAYQCDSLRDDYALLYRWAHQVKE